MAVADSVAIFDLWKLLYFWVSVLNHHFVKDGHRQPTLNSVSAKKTWMFWAWTQLG